MTELVFSNSEGRGRNGWFRVASAQLHDYRNKVEVNITSKRPVVPGPIYLELSAEDAVLLGRALIEKAEGLAGTGVANQQRE